MAGDNSGYPRLEIGSRWRSLAAVAVDNLQGLSPAVGGRTHFLSKHKSFRFFRGPDSRRRVSTLGVPKSHLRRREPRGHRLERQRQIGLPAAGRWTAAWSKHVRSQRG
ncbi:hypothetical protein ARTHRO9AX_10273 [Arthrobacter sp. 9AX]|nr:hypothetical protein ARTHRO9AX_10273 [Arthrobacter sp. 9AX]